MNQQNTDIHAHKILILDFGSQYTQLIARRIREIGVYCEIYACDCSEEAVKNFGAKGIILSGGPESVTLGNTPRAPQAVFDAGIPVLGICYGMQTMTEQLGGKVESSDHREFGYAQIRARGHSKLLKDIEDEVNAEGFGLLDVWMSHGDRVVDLPEGFKLIASSDGAPIAGIANEEKDFYGVQFHPEVTHTKQGGRMLSRFVLDICACDALWDSTHIIDENIALIKEKVGKEQVILGLSGGGAMTSAMLVNYPDIFTAGAVVAGIPFPCADGLITGISCMRNGPSQTVDELVSLTEKLNPKQKTWPKLSVWTGAADDIVSPLNSKSLAKQWAKLSGITANPNVFKKSGYTLTQWQNENKTPHVELVEVTELGHGIMVNPKVENGGEVSDYLLASPVSTAKHVIEFWQLR